MSGVVAWERPTPMVVCTRECECNIDPCRGAALSVLLLTYGVLTCCDCCSGNCLDVCTYEKLPFCKTPLEPNGEMGDLPETTLVEIDRKLGAANEQLLQLDEEYRRRKRIHRCASTLLCPLVVVPRSCTEILHIEDDFYPSQNSRPSPETSLDLIYQFTLPLLKQEEEMGRVGLRQFLSPPEVQRMIELENTIIPTLKDKARRYF